MCLALCFEWKSRVGILHEAKYQHCLFFLAHTKYMQEVLFALLFLDFSLH